MQANRVDWENQTERVTVRVPAPLLDDFDMVADQGHYQNRSEAFRDAIREFVEARE